LDCGIINNMDYSYLKSGSDIRGTASDVLGEVVNLDERAVCTIVDAFVYWLSEKKQNKKLKIAVGYDSRITSVKIHSCVIRALKFAGCVICDCELASTPCMFMMTVLQPECDGAIMVTASHLPKDKNGLKFFTSSGGLLDTDIDSIIQLAKEGKCKEGQECSHIKKDFLGIYCDYLINKARQLCGEEFPFYGLKISLDASNGTGGFFAKRVLGILGADVSGSQYLEPNGDFPNHIPNPEDATAMESISRCVVGTRADLGIIFDTDADRVAFVDSNGKSINRNRLIALISAILLKEEPKGYIITDSTTSSGLSQFILEHKGRHHRYKRGYSNVIGEAKRFMLSNMNALLAIETTGHAALKENFFLDDGAYLAIRIVSALAKLKKEGLGLEDLIKTLKEPLEEGEARIKLKVADYKTLGDNIIKAMTDWVKVEFELDGISYEGVRARIKQYDAWFMARVSIHEPAISINIETNVEGSLKIIAQMLYNKLTLIDGVDASALLKLV